jgi:hypothetical protein
MEAASETLLYVGAGEDIAPLVFPYRFTAAVGQHVYTDARKSNGYCSTVSYTETVASVLGELEESMRMWTRASFTRDDCDAHVRALHVWRRARVALLSRHDN